MEVKHKILLGVLFIMLLSASFVSATSMKLGTVEEQAEHQAKLEKFFGTSFLLLLFVCLGIILGNWLRHVKEKNSSRYIFQGILSFFIGFIHVVISLFISVVVYLFLGLVFEAAAAFFAYIIFILLIIIGCFLEFHYYKKGNKLYWAYALAFTIILLMYIIIIHLTPYSVSGFRGLFY